VRVGNLAHQVVYQVFWTRTDPKRELFRIEVGDYSNGKGAQLWNYGIANEGDFNGDGLPDYSWYGGDDTAVRMYLFLSSSTGYKRVDLMKTVEASWRQRFHKPAPDLSDNGSGYGFSEAVLERSPTGLILHANIHYANLDETKKATYRFDIVEADFKP
jgi:hypothetical protein